ncbi:MAG TPA: hypothetical protein VIK39_19505 [Candidatus Angelobacter sp.]
MRVVPIKLVHENQDPPLLNPPDATTDKTTQGSIDVDRWGRFYADSGNGLLVGDLYSAGSFGARAVILLHELAHKIDPKGFQDDVDPGQLGMPNTSKSEANSKLVVDKCKDAIDGKK